jgi:hypothetical protein
MPSWDPQRKTRPPLSPGDALTAANQIALKVFPEMTWESATISMGPLGHVQDHRKWVYSVKYFDKVENEADKSFTLNAFLVVVRMDGVAVEPEIMEELTSPSQGTNNINPSP